MCCVLPTTRPKGPVFMFSILLFSDHDKADTAPTESGISIDFLSIKQRYMGISLENNKD